jgi:hypothetical protein
MKVQVGMQMKVQVGLQMKVQVLVMQDHRLEGEGKEVGGEDLVHGSDFEYDGLVVTCYATFVGLVI